MQDAPAPPSSFALFLGFLSVGMVGFARRRRQVQAGLVPVTAGLIMASAVLLIRTTSTELGTAAIITVATLLFLFTRLHPLLALGAAAALGATGLLT